MGGKSAACAHNSAGPLAAGSGNAVPAANAGAVSCQEHWIGVRVEDENANVLKDVTLRISMTNGSTSTVNFATAAIGADGAYNTGKVMPAGNCEISLPGIEDVEWWPKEAGSAAQVPADDGHDVRSGDCAVSIAENYGFRNYHSFWDLPENQALRNRRINANMLAPGDEVQVSDSKKKTVMKAVDQAWTFVVRKQQPAKLRIVLLGPDDKPLDQAKWTLKSPIAQSGTTGADGLIEIADLRRNEMKGELEVEPKAGTKFGPITDAAGAPTDYPPKLKHKQFIDPRDDEPAGAGKITFKLAIGSLPAHDAPRGAAARLHNLGFACGVWSNDKQVMRSVKAYQRLYKNQKAGSGKAADIQNDLRDHHDKP